MEVVYCKKCGSKVMLTKEGTCPLGHPLGEAAEAEPQPVETAPAPAPEPPPADVAPAPIPEPLPVEPPPAPEPIEPPPAPEPVFEPAPVAEAPVEPMAAPEPVFEPAPVVEAPVEPMAAPEPLPADTPPPFDFETPAESELIIESPMEPVPVEAGPPMDAPPAVPEAAPPFYDDPVVAPPESAPYTPPAEPAIPAETVLAAEAPYDFEPPPEPAIPEPAFQEPPVQEPVPQEPAPEAGDTQDPFHTPPPTMEDSSSRPETDPFEMVAEDESSREGLTEELVKGTDARRLWIWIITAIVVIIVLGFLTIAIVLAMPAFQLAGIESDKNACFANQLELERAANLYLAEGEYRTVEELAQEDGHAWEGLLDYYLDDVEMTCPTNDGGYELNSDTEAVCADGSHVHHSEEE